MISLNALYTKLLLNVLYAKKEKIEIYLNRLRSAVEIVPNNVCKMHLIFENDAISVQTNNIVHIANKLVFKNHISSIKKYYSSIYQKVNNLKLFLFKILPILL